MKSVQVNVKVENKNHPEVAFRRKCYCQNLRTWGEDFFSKKKEAKTFFTIIFENPRFDFSKKAIFEDQKVIFVGSSDSSVLIGV